MQEPDDRALALVSAAVDRELHSREALNARLTGTVTFAGALLALALGLGSAAGQEKLSGLWRTAFDLCFALAVAFLFMTVVAGVWAMSPRPRHLIEPELFRHYVLHGRPIEALLGDAYKSEVAVLVQLGDANGDQARSQIGCQRLLAVALAATAAGALILFFCR